MVVSLCVNYFYCFYFIPVPSLLCVVVCCNIIPRYKDEQLVVVFFSSNNCLVITGTYRQCSVPHRIINNTQGGGGWFY